MSGVILPFDAVCAVTVMLLKSKQIGRRNFKVELGTTERKKEVAKQGNS